MYNEVQNKCPACGSNQHDECCGMGIEEGEACLFPNMPWIHDIIGSQLEAELIADKDKISREEWERKFNLRIAIGKHDLRRRGFD